MLFKISAFKKFANFTGKHLCWSFLLIKLKVFRPVTLLKRDFNTGAFLLLQNISGYSFWRFHKEKFEQRDYDRGLKYYFLLQKFFRRLIRSFVKLGLSSKKWRVVSNSRLQLQSGFRVPWQECFNLWYWR